MLRTFKKKGHSISSDYFHLVHSFLHSDFSLCYCWFWNKYLLYIVPFFHLFSILTYQPRWKREYLFNFFFNKCKNGWNGEQKKQKFIPISFLLTHSFPLSVVWFLSIFTQFALSTTASKDGRWLSSQNPKKDSISFQAERSILWSLNLWSSRDRLVWPVYISQSHSRSLLLNI